MIGGKIKNNKGWYQTPSSGLRMTGRAGLRKLLYNKLLINFIAYPNEEIIGYCFLSNRKEKQN